MKIKVVAQKALFDNVELKNSVSATLPSFEFGTTELKGAGIMGTMNIPSVTDLAAMSTTISFRGLGNEKTKLLVPGKHTLELRFVEDTKTSTGEIKPAGTKIFMSILITKIDNGKVENSTSMDSSLEASVTRYQEYQDGKEIVLVDQSNYIFKLNGKDYAKEYNAFL